MFDNASAEGWLGVGEASGEDRVYLSGFQLEAGGSYFCGGGGIEVIDVERAGVDGFKWAERPGAQCFACQRRVRGATVGDLVKERFPVLDHIQCAGAR